MRNHNLTHQQRCDLELIVTGGLAPLTGFMGKEDYVSVLSNMRLANGKVFPIPVTLDVPEEIIIGLSVGDQLALVRSDNSPLAILCVNEIYNVNLIEESLAIYGTDDPKHAGVAALLSKSSWYIGGDVAVIDAWQYDIARLTEFSPSYIPPNILKPMLTNKKVPIVAFQTRNPLHHAHRALTETAIDAVGGHLLLHPTIGPTKPGDIDATLRIKAYRAILAHYPKNTDGTSRVTLSTLPLAMRMAGPREALWHAIIRKNFGATHFVIGRAHADPGGNPKRSDGFWHDPYAAQELVKRFTLDIGIVPLTFSEFGYSESLKKHVSVTDMQSLGDIQTISGTEVRRRLMTGEEIPEWFSPSDVISVLREGYRGHPTRGLVVFLTGLSGAGKSTLAGMISNWLRDHDTRSVTVLDGDIIRKFLSKGLGFSREDRNENIRRIGFVSGLVSHHGGIVIVSAIAPYSEARADAKRLVEEGGGLFIEVYVSTPLEICKERDPKGLYKMAERGEIKGFTGIDDPYEIPVSPDITLDLQDSHPRQALEDFLNFLARKGVIERCEG
jgi:sulfate adenylyltransferase